MYSSGFCRAYNEFGWNVYPEVFAGQLLIWLERNGAEVSSCLDLGCGTGVLCQTLYEHGITASGVDLSEGMIAIARERASALRFEVADMTLYRPDERFDLVTCTGDALNHIFDLADVRRVFENVHTYLREGGYFIFDLLSEGEIPPGEPFDLDFSESIRATFLTTRGSDGLIHLDISVYENGVLQYEENIREKLHEPEQVCALLRESGFAVTQCADRLLTDADTHGTTWFIVARRV